MQEPAERHQIGYSGPAAVAGHVPSAESIAAKIEAYEARKNAKKAARAAAQGKTSSGKSPPPALMFPIPIMHQAKVSIDSAMLLYHWI